MFKPAIDDRYHKEKVVSHDGNELEAINISTSRDILLQDLSHVDVIGIDEIQFFDKEIVNIVEKLAENGHRVVVAGLDMDFRGNHSNPCHKSWRYVNKLLNYRLYVQYVVHHQVEHNA